MTNFENNSKITHFEENIQKWVSLDNQLRLINEKAREVREKKANLMESLIDYAETNQIENANIQISDGRLKFTKTQVTEPLTFKYLEKTLSEIIRDTTQVKQIIAYIKRSREIKVVQEIKRFP